MCGKELGYGELHGCDALLIPPTVAYKAGNGWTCLLGITNLQHLTTLSGNTLRRKLSTSAAFEAQGCGSALFASFEIATIIYNKLFKVDSISRLSCRTSD